MKSKAMTILAVLAVIGLVAGAAWAGPWGGPRDGYHRGYGPGMSGGYCYYGSGGPQSQAFLDETADLRKELAGKRGEYQALMAQENPDPKRASQLQQEMEQIREQLRAKARKYDNAPAYGGPSGDRGYGGGWAHHRGPRGYCW